MTQYRRPESVLVVVYTRAGEALLLHRVGSRPYWQSVTGSLEWGETRLETARRELFEETGLESVLPQDCSWSTEFEIYPERLVEYAPGISKNREYVFRLELESRPQIKLNPSEHDDYCWLPFKQAAALVYSYSNKNAILSIMALKPEE